MKSICAHRTSTSEKIEITATQMNLFIVITLFTVIFCLLVSIFRMIAHKAEQFIELYEKIDSSREIVQHSPTVEMATNLNKKAA